MYTGSFFILNFQPLWQIERLDKEDCHLSAGHIRIWTVDARTTAARDAFSGKLFDPFVSPIADRYICEDSSRGWRSICCAMFCFEQEDGHLCAGHSCVGTIDTGPAPAGDAFGGELFDPRGGPIACGHIGKACAGSHGGRSKA